MLLHYLHLSLHLEDAFAAVADPAALSSLTFAASWDAFAAVADVAALSSLTFAAS